MAERDMYGVRLHSSHICCAETLSIFRRSNEIAMDITSNGAPPMRQEHCVIGTGGCFPTGIQGAVPQESLHRMHAEAENLCCYVMNVD